LPNRSPVAWGTQGIALGAYILAVAPNI